MFGRLRRVFVTRFEAYQTARTERKFDQICEDLFDFSEELVPVQLDLDFTKGFNQPSTTLTS